ncbi:MAG: hypothetical protein ACRC1K_25205 [Planctomycetia bacterium]
MYERGAALSALSYFKSHAEECLPVLIEAMESFEEYDSDENYDGPLGRISGVIAGFGAKASAAVMPLVQHLNDCPTENPKNILTALANIGPSAKAAIPALQEFRRSYENIDCGDDDKDVIDDWDDVVDWTIQQIQSVPRR